MFLTCTGTDKPTLKLFIEYVRDEVAPKWYDFGIQLLQDEYIAKLNNIAHNHSKIEECCNAMFSLWLEIDPEASWDRLIEALSKIGLKALAVNIKENLLQGTLMYLSCVTNRAT